MRSLLVVLATAAALIMVSVDGNAADYELKGFTNATFDADKTVRGFTTACQAELGADTRMCTTMEVFQTVNWPSLPANTKAWTHPVLAPNPQDTAVLDHAGAQVGTTDVGRMGCFSWTSKSADYFGAVTWNEFPGFPAGNTFLTATTCNETLGVACCGPVPEPTMAHVPLLLWFGRGALVAFMLSAVGAMYLFRSRAAVSSGQGNPSLRG